ncbi:MAG: HNH endonuclease [Dehalococcoidia bacterium]|nr:HNH endonuclease [Dehalococcoidia bacterium]
MATHRPDVPNQLKKRLRATAGGKCANPGCSALRTHLHHIREWAAYAAHDESQMIAVCPACHDAVHHGSLTISDDTLFRWKHLRRPASALRTLFEPGTPLRLGRWPYRQRSRAPSSILANCSPRLQNDRPRPAAQLVPTSATPTP